ncbi:hypothetical protein BJY52DRAFT_1420703 [Lactarius psammicola]|nr:hypothetical protein BJY52DRAFT_1420703 [Lactarius psammicola]
MSSSVAAAVHGVEGHIGGGSLAARAGWGQGVWVGRLHVGQPLGTFSSLHTIIPVLDQPIHFRESIFVQRVVSGSGLWKEHPVPHLLSLEHVAEVTMAMVHRRTVKETAAQKAGSTSEEKGATPFSGRQRNYRGRGYLVVPFKSGRRARIAELAGYTLFGRPELESAPSIQSIRQKLVVEEGQTLLFAIDVAPRRRVLSSMLHLGMSRGWSWEGTDCETLYRYIGNCRVRYQVPAYLAITNDGLHVPEDSRADAGKWLKEREIVPSEKGAFLRAHFRRHFQSGEARQPGNTALPPPYQTLFFSFLLENDLTLTLLYINSDPSRLVNGQARAPPRGLCAHIRSAGLSTWCAWLAGVLDVVPFAWRCNEAVTAAVAPAAEQSETPPVSRSAHVSFKRAQGSVVLDVDSSSVFSTTRHYQLRKVFDAALDRRPK